MPAGTFGRRIITGTYRDIHIIEVIYNHPNTRPGGIRAAIFGLGVKCGAGDLTCTATNTFIKINFYLFNDFLFQPSVHG
jgi:hypothetical protein